MNDAVCCKSLCTSDGRSLTERYVSYIGRRIGYKVNMADASHDERLARAYVGVYGASPSRALALVIIHRIREQAKAGEREFHLLMAAIAPRSKRRPRRTC